MRCRPSVKYIGHVAMVRTPIGFEGSLEEFAQSILRERGNVKSVLLFEGVEGVYRLPRVRFLAGDPNTVTVHRENGMVFKFDVGKLMFSLGNSFERKRLMTLPREGEVVVDMFAGVGQFTVPTALSKAAKVYAFEINPEAYEYLLENIKLNKVEGKVVAFLEDCMNAPQHGLINTADRVVMGYFFGTLAYLPTAIKIAKDGAVIHFHEVAATRDGWMVLYEKCRAVAENNNVKVELMGKRLVKTYSGSRAHWVLDLLLRK